jgi:hypothetical protein
VARATSNLPDSPAPAVVGRAPVRHDGPEVRAKVTEDLYEALQREAGSRRLSVAECVRRILQAHYDRAAGSPPELIRRLDDLNGALEQAHSERELLIGMIDLMYKGLLIRLERPTEEEVDRRASDAADGYEKWKVALERHLDDGAFEDLLRLVEVPPNT